ncbi:cysteine methyltransferase [Candidatus Micrarchaeota archaeon CG08_land_8_20_14_0_20_59_11]|nr:MAG: cysteine methyltransferase [Candidatus Micrarchaeota archaeon CG08_land_8_20_14_0_20_59_11]
MDFKQRVFEACKRIPKGRVATYSAIARAIGNPKAARAVGNALDKNRSSLVPCHRVIRSDGRAGGFAHGTKEKIRLLRKEGVKIRNGKVQGKRFELLNP